MQSNQKTVWKAEKVNAVNENEEVLLGYCEVREATLGCENFDSGIIKTIEWYLNKYGIGK